MPNPVVAIVGRPNVGKSTLFNRIAGRREAIVDDVPGVTRDRLYREAEWSGRRFTLVDTGGIAESDDQLAVQVRRQAEMALNESDVVLYVIDARSGLTADDWAVADILRRAARPVILVANKVENFADTSLSEFYQLGLGDPVPVSAAHGLNIGDLLDLVLAHLPPETEAEEAQAIKVAVAGRPNVGKSSLVNRILGEERVIVSQLPGTTRDAIDTPFTLEGQDYILIDTAGLRRQARIEAALERYSVQRALAAMRRCDVALVLIDGVEGVTEQDKKIAGFCHNEGKAAVILVNKWDLVHKETGTAERYRKNLRDEMIFNEYAPVLFISALTGQRVVKVMEAVKAVYAESRRRVATGPLNDLIRQATIRNPPPFKFFYATQLKVGPPTFILFVDQPQEVHFSYQRYLENQLREAYGFSGSPIRLVFRRGRD